MPATTIVASYGLDDFKRSMAALKFFTTFGSSEFAIRHFLLQDFGRTLAVLQTWSLDANDHVRRLASEGSRPRLPWSFRLAEIQANPELCASILDNLKADPSLYVRPCPLNPLCSFFSLRPCQSSVNPAAPSCRPVLLLLL